MKYNKKTILDYISGNDLEYDIELLEKDSNFMLDVLNHTKDKKIIQFCDQSLLNDPIFIYNLLDVFKEDRLFCIKLASNFIKKHKNYNVETINVALKAQEINNDIYNQEEEELFDLSLYLQVAYIEFKIMLENKMKDENLGNTMNFGIILCNFPQDDLFKKFIAKNMINDIFNSLEKSFELYIKSGYSSPNYIDNIGSEQFILDLIRGHDEDLADYTEFHLDIIYNKIITLDFIINEWKKEINNYEDEISEIIEAFYEQHNEVFLDDYIKYISKELNLPGLLENTFESMNENLIISGYEPIDYSDMTTSEVDEITKKRLFNKLKKGILLYIQNNKKNKQSVEKITNIQNLRLIKKCNNKLDI